MFDFLKPYFKPPPRKVFSRPMARAAKDESISDVIKERNLTEYQAIEQVFSERLSSIETFSPSRRFLPLHDDQKYRFHSLKLERDYEYSVIKGVLFDQVFFGTTIKLDNFSEVIIYPSDPEVAPSDPKYLDTVIIILVKVNGSDTPASGVYKIYSLI